MENLFRKEVISAKQGSLLGNITIANRLNHSLIAALAVVLAISIMAFLFLAKISLNSRVNGILLPRDGMLQVAAQATGVITAIYVKEGDFVEQGTIIASINIERATTSGSTAEVILQNIRSQQRSYQADKLNRDSLIEHRKNDALERIRAIEEQQARLGDELTLTKRRLELLKDNYQSLRKLNKEGFASEAHLQLKQSEILDGESRVNSVLRAQAELNAQRNAQYSEIAQLKIQHDSEKAEIDRSLATLNRAVAEIELTRQSAIVAPSSGRLVSLNMQRGQQVGNGQVLAMVVPGIEKKMDPMIATFFASSKTTGFIEPGQLVMVRYEAYPYQKFGMAKGKVKSVSGAPLSAQDMPSSLANFWNAVSPGSEPMYRIDVILDEQYVEYDGKRFPLKAGMTCEADVIRERRALWELILEPFIAAKRKQEFL